MKHLIINEAIRQFPGIRVKATKFGISTSTNGWMWTNVYSFEEEVNIRDIRKENNQYSVKVLGGDKYVSEDAAVWTKIPKARRVKHGKG